MEEKFANLSTTPYMEIRDTLRSGDILLCSGNSLFSNMIKQATNSIWSHVGFILRLDLIDRIMVLESVESVGVRTVPLSSYAFDYNGTGKGYDGKILIARHRHFKQESISQLSKLATNLLGYPYHTQEILRIAARISMHPIGNRSHFMDHKTTTAQREFICSEYADFCFKSVGIHVNPNPLGFIAPADFARCPQIDPISFVNTEEKTT